MASPTVQRSRQCMISGLSPVFGGVALQWEETSPSPSPAAADALRILAVRYRLGDSDA